DEENAREAADNNLQSAIDDISHALANKKEKQTGISYAGGNTKTITNLRQDENGKIEFVSFADIEFPEANNGTLTIKQGDSVKGTFSANQATDTEVNLDYANDGTTRLLNDEGTVIGDFTADQASNKDITISRDVLDVYSKAQVDAKTIPISFSVAPGVSGSANAVSFIRDISGLQQGSIDISTPDFSSTLYTIPSYNDNNVNKLLAVKYNETRGTYYLDWVEAKPKIIAVALGNNIYQAAPYLNNTQTSRTLITDFGSIPTPISLTAGKTYIIQPSVVGTADYTLAIDDRSSRFSLDLLLVEADSQLTYGNFVPIATTQFNLKSTNGSNLAGYRFISPIGSNALTYTPDTDKTFTKIVLSNDGNVLGSNGTTRCYMDFVLGSVVITEV
ncbi:MAG: hypothetical protein HUJ56_09925, partial [Erysipelotrichaceae bacterium]|nr:hypothetical protein [Erysipelotrichaceae bacterium]